MKTFTRITGLFTALAATFALAFAPATAADVVTAGSRNPTVLFSAVDSSTADYTNATTSASDLTGVTITVPATRYSIAKQFYRACLYADVTKGTATSGTLTINVNGSDVAATARQIQSAAGRGSISVCHVAARPTASAFVVKVRGVSADTNTFTVHNSQFAVEVFNAI